MKKTYKVLARFGLSERGMFGEGAEESFWVAAKPPEKGNLTFMSLDEEKALLAQGRIEEVAVVKGGREVKADV